jgi:hypothetical protein
MPASHVKRIVFTGDFLRPSVAGTRPTQHNNIRWLKNLVAAQIDMATRLPQSVVSWGVDGVKDGQLTFADVVSIYADFGLDHKIEDWAQIHGAERLPTSFEAILDYFFADSLAIAFELPPYLEHYFERRGIPFLAATIHPVRFLDDIFLGWRSNSPEIGERLFAHRIDEDFIRTMAGIQRASAARTMVQALKPNSALFVMQTWYDQTQIEKGRFVSAENFLDQIVAIAREHSELLLKEHPIDTNPATALIRSSVPNLRMVTGNIYGYLSVPEISLIGTLSSSVGVEAPYFGVPTRFLLRNPLHCRRTAEDPADGYVGILDAFLAPDFWREMLEPLVPVGAADGIRVPAKPNRLRISLRSFWNFNQIDTDVTAGLLK